MPHPMKKDPRGNAARVEYFIKGAEPKDDDLCDVHIQARVCTASRNNLSGYGVNLLAGPYCPSDKVVEKVFIQRPAPYFPLMPGEKAPKDVAYELVAGEHCNIHGAPEQSRPDTAVTTGTAITTDIEENPD
jgi:penicillin-binding protein 1A